VRFDIVAEARAGLLCRLIGLIAQHDAVAPEVQVTVTGETMLARIDIQDVPEVACVGIAYKMARCIGVDSVAVDGVLLSLSG
jgi:hypothetical protein